MLFANIGVSCRLWASEIGLRGTPEDVQRIPTAEEAAYSRRGKGSAN